MVFKANHDVKFLAAGEELDKAYYMMKYAAKEQNAIENEAVLRLNAFDKAIGGREDSGDSVRFGKRVIMSMISSLSNPQEVAGPLAGLYFLRESVVYGSHEFESLFLPSILGALADDPISLPLTRSEHSGRYTYANVFEEYVQRPEELEAVNLMGYRRQYVKIRGTTASVRKRDVPVVVTVFGENLPNINDDSLPVSERKRYCNIMMTLFMPFRKRDDIPDDDAIVQAFDQWWDLSAGEDAHVFGDNIADVHVSKGVCRERRDTSEEYFESCDAAQHDENDCIDYDEGESDFSCESDEKEGMESGPMSPTEVGSCRLLSSVENGQSCVKLTAALLNSIPDDSSIANEALSMPANSVAIDTPCDVVHATRVTTVEDNPMDPPWRAPSDRVSHSSTNDLRAISEAHNFNKKQHEAFVSAGAALLKSLFPSGPDTVEGHHFCGFVGGLPGAGKSQVIRALQALARAWHRPKSVKTIAYQGIAGSSGRRGNYSQVFWVESQK